MNVIQIQVSVSRLLGIILRKMAVKRSLDMIQFHVKQAVCEVGGYL